MQKIPSESLDIDRKDRVYMPYLGLDYRPARERVFDFKETIEPFDENRARYEASRCIHCPDPAGCMVACPLHNDIPSIMWLIEQGQFTEAARLFRQTSSMPEICGRVCPQEQLCEGSCVLNVSHEPVTIGALEVFVTDYEHLHAGYSIPVGKATGNRVAVVGGGPSGLACAERLVRYGHSVTVFETHPLPGGLLLYGIPGFKMSQRVFMNKLGKLLKTDIQFINNICIGEDKTVDDLLIEGYDAVYLSVGAGVEVELQAPGEALPGVYHGIDFLIRANVPQDLLPEGMACCPEVGKKVAIIGGGDTASDCLRTALRLGAEEVTCVYRRSEKELPGTLKDRKLAAQEGAQFLFQTLPVRFIAGDNGRLAAMECVKIILGEPDGRGRRKPVPVEGSNFTIPVDTAVLALGFWPYPVIGETTPGLETRQGGLIVADAESGATSRPGIFAGGDAVSGPKLVVTAVADGQRAAEAINQHLAGR